jgi:hypothetical protein
VKIGDVVDVAEHWVAVLSIDTRDSATLISNEGRKIEVSARGMTEMVPEVWIGLGPDATSPVCGWCSKRPAISRSRGGTIRESARLQRRQFPWRPRHQAGETTVKNKSKRFKKDMLAAMRAAIIPPQIIYAYERTGFLLSEERYKNLSPVEKAEYDAAIDEYFAKGNAK